MIARTTQSTEPNASFLTLANYDIKSLTSAIYGFSKMTNTPDGRDGHAFEILGNSSAVRV